MTRGATPEGEAADTELAQRLRSGRASTGLNQREMAQELGISPSELSRYERAIVRPDLQRLLALCERYGLDVAEMVQLRASTPGSGRGRRRPAGGEPTRAEAEGAAAVDLPTEVTPEMRAVDELAADAPAPSGRPVAPKASARGRARR